MTNRLSRASSVSGRYAPTAALCLYALLLLAGLATIVSMLDELQARRATVSAASDQAAQLTARGMTTTQLEALPSDIAPGAAYLGDEKLSVASADLQRRVTTAVAKAGGAVLSSQVEKQEPKGPVTGVELTVECDIDQNGLQRLLYELESTAPFLFVEAMNVRARNDSRDGDVEQRLRASLRLAANWRNQEP